MTWTWSFSFACSESRLVSSVLFPPLPSSRSGNVQICLLWPDKNICQEHTKYVFPHTTTPSTPETRCPRLTGWQARSPPCPRWTSRPRYSRRACRTEGSGECQASFYAPDDKKFHLWVHNGWLQNIWKHHNLTCFANLIKCRLFCIISRGKSSLITIELPLRDFDFCNTALRS